MAAAMAVVLLFSAGPLVAQTTIWVDDDNCPGPGAGTELDPFCTIQDAICSIKDSGGGTVLVGPGTYNESLRMFPGVSVVSTDGPSVTTIDGTGIPCTTSACVPSQNNLVCSTVVFGSGSMEHQQKNFGEPLLRDIPRLFDSPRLSQMQRAIRTVSILMTKFIQAFAS